MTNAAFIMLRAPTGRVLLLRRSDVSDHEGEWDLPGGTVEPGETTAGAAVRETLDETGYRTGVAGRFHMRSVRDGVDATTFLFDCDSEFVPTLDDEHTEFRWVLPAEALKDDAELLSKQRSDADWSESEHPRERGGKFTSGGGGAGTEGASSPTSPASSAPATSAQPSKAAAGSSARQAAVKEKIKDFLGARAAQVFAKVGKGLKENQSKLLATAVSASLYHLAGIDFPVDVEAALHHEVEHFAHNAKMSIAMAREHMRNAVKELITERGSRRDAVEDSDEVLAALRALLEFLDRSDEKRSDEK